MGRAAAVWLVLATTALPAQVAGQVVAGTVTELGSTRPVVGAMVRLFDEAGPTGARYLTSSDGAYRLRTPGAGTYWLEVERIGFARSRRGPVEVGAAATVSFDVEVEAEPILLEGLDVAATGGRCSLVDAEGDQTQLVWDEARKALAAATWTEREVGLRFDVELRRRSLGPEGRRVREEERQGLQMVGGNSVRSLPPEDLVEGGYVREREGQLYYYGPDAEVLLSDAFLRTHCFRVVQGPEEQPHLLGLAFEPVPDRDTTDIEGVLLLDRATARLERVEFAYTGLRAGPGRNQANGMVRFMELADGRWVIRDWVIRAPVLALERTVGAGGQLRDRLVVASVQEFGSEVRSVQGPGGVSWSSDHPVGRMRGTVWDSLRGGPLPGAEIRLAGRGWRTRSDTLGRWELTAIPPGAYRVTYSHPELDSLGVGTLEEEATVEADGVTEVPLAVPSLGRILAMECGEPGSGVVVGYVRDAAGRPVPQVEVVAMPAGSEEPGAFAVTGADGTFRLCGLPAGDEIAVEAVLGPVVTSRHTVETVADLAVRVDLTVEAETSIRTVAPAEPVGVRLVGRVVALGSGQPLDGVSLELAGEDGRVVARALTDEEGRFELAPDAPGSYRLRTQRLGYAPLDQREVEVGRGSRRVEIRLPGEAVEVEGVMVEVEGRDRTLELAGFYERREQGMGILLDREALDAMNLSQTGDIVNRVGGLANVPQSTRGSMDSNRRFLMFRRAARASGCMPAIFVDGNLTRQGGRWNRAMPTLDEIIPADEVEALELYEGPAATPARFSAMGGACGVIVIWSRSPGNGGF